MVNLDQMIQKRLIIFFVLICFSTLVLLPFENIAQTSGPEVILKNSSEILPYPFSRGSAVWVEEQDCVYIFGGRNETEILDRIMKYTPSTGNLEILDTHLPTVLMGSTAVYDGKFVYIFGGKDFDDFYDTILKFDPLTGTVTNMTAKLPNPTVGGAAVWTGRYIYFFGGCWGGILHQKFDTVLRYDPTKDNITLLNSTLPYGRSGLAATWDGQYIYVIGGSDGKQFSDEVYKYSPYNDTLTTLPGKLPIGRTHIQAIYHNGSIFIFGGCSAPTELLDQVVKYDLGTNEVTVLEVKLAMTSEFRMHAYDGENIYIIGGFDGPKNINQFITFVPESDSQLEPGPICPQENEYESIGFILLIVGFVIVIVLYNKYKKKKN